MYRSYENPEALKKELEALQHEFTAATDDETRLSLHDEIEEIKERLNFAYQDQEAG